ncbi:MAG: hydroxyacid dehydrogenase [Bacteroidales bacterium]|nr:hydroxyacid dehydrogenase [Bacteroidales bacterium]
MNIVFAEPIGLTVSQKKSFVEEIEELGHSVRFFDNIPSSQDDLIKRIKDFDVLVISNYKIASEVIEASENLKMIAVAFTGVDHIPMDLCRSKGIVVCNAAGYSTQGVAELAIALSINLYRKIIPLDNATRLGRTRDGFLGGELNGKIFGIIGLGAIGERVARLALAFGCKVIVWSRNVKALEGVDFVELEYLLKNADIVSLHLPLTDKTLGLINESNLKLMKPSAVLINTARGPIVDSKALANALKTGIIGGAAIDVYEHEPPIEENHPLFSVGNTILLPHIGFATKEAICARSDIVINNIKSWITGKTENQV